MASGNLPRWLSYPRACAYGPLWGPGPGTMLGTMEFEHILVQRLGDFPARLV
jgi:hypothetical protein